VAEEVEEGVVKAVSADVMLFVLPKLNPVTDSPMAACLTK